jgi:hypothetical protein
MTVAHDSIDESATWTTTPDPFTFDHTPVGTPRGVIVLITINAEGGADGITSVTYGGVAMTRASPGFAQDTLSEPGSAYLYFLGSGIPTGVQTVSINHTAGSGVKIATCCTVTAAADTEIAAAGVISEDATNPQIALDSGADSALRYCVINSGHGVVGNVAPLSGMSAVSDIDHGSRIVRVDRQTTAGSGSFTIGYTATIEDVAMCAAAIKEVAGGVTVTPAAASAIAGSINPTVVHGSIAIEPSAVNAVTSIVAPEVVLGSLTLTPAVLQAIAQTINPTVVQGSIAIEPGAVNAIASIVAPEVVLGSLMLTPSAIQAIAQTIDPAVSGGDLIVAPAAIYTIAQTVDPGVVHGSIAFTPGAAGAIARTLDPEVVIPILVTPAAVWAVARTNDPNVLGVFEVFVLLTLEPRDGMLTLASRPTELRLKARGAA